MGVHEKHKTPPQESLKKHRSPFITITMSSTALTNTPTTSTGPSMDSPTSHAKKGKLPSGYWGGRHLYMYKTIHSQFINDSNVQIRVFELRHDWGKKIYGHKYRVVKQYFFSPLVKVLVSTNSYLDAKEKYDEFVKALSNPDSASSPLMAMSE